MAPQGLSPEPTAFASGLLMMTGIDTMRTEDDHMAQDNPFGLDDDADNFEEVEEEKKSAP